MHVNKVTAIFGWLDIWYKQRLAPKVAFGVLIHTIFQNLQHALNNIRLFFGLNSSRLFDHTK